MPLPTAGLIWASHAEGWRMLATAASIHAIARRACRTLTGDAARVEPHHCAAISRLQVHLIRLCEWGIWRVAMACMHACVFGVRACVCGCVVDLVWMWYGMVWCGVDVVWCGVVW